MATQASLIQELTSMCEHLDADPEEPIDRLIALGSTNRVGLCRLCSNALVGEIVQELTAQALPAMMLIAQQLTKEPKEERKPKIKFQQG